MTSLRDVDLEDLNDGSYLRKTLPSYNLMNARGVSGRLRRPPHLVSLLVVTGGTGKNAGANEDMKIQP